MPLFSVAPEENPADVQGRGTLPTNLVITWTVSHKFVCCRAGSQTWLSLFCTFIFKLNKLITCFCTATDRISVQRSGLGVQGPVEAEGRGRGLVQQERGQRLRAGCARNAHLRAVRDQGSSHKRLRGRSSTGCGDWILWRGL